MDDTLINEINIGDKRGLFNLAMNLFRKRIMGTLEATNRLCGHPCYESSVAQQWLSCDPPENRARLLKSKIQLAEIAEQNKGIDEEENKGIDLKNVKSN